VGIALSDAFVWTNGVYKKKQGLRPASLSILTGIMPTG